MRRYASPRYRHKTAPRPHNTALRIIEELRNGPATAAELAAAVYGDDPDGGPDWALSCIYVAMHWLRKQGCQIASGHYKLISTRWEIADMNEPHGREITRGKKTKATDYLPPGESVRIARMIKSFEGQRNAAMSALAICEGQLAAKDFEIDALKRVIAELNEQREAAWAKPGNMQPNDPEFGPPGVLKGEGNLAGSDTVVPG